MSDAQCRPGPSLQPSPKGEGFPHPLPREEGRGEGPEHKPISRTTYLLLVLTFCLLWSSAFPGAKFAMMVGPPSLFLAVRFALAGVLMLAWCAWRGQLRGLPWLTLLPLGMLNMAGYQGLAWQGMLTNSSGLAAIIASLNPILITLAAAPLLGERLTGRKILGLALGLGGAAYVVRDRVAFGETLSGVLWLIGALVAMVAGTLAFKRLNPCASLAGSVGVQQLGGACALLVAGLLTEDPGRFVLGMPLVWTMLWYVFVASIASLSLWFLLLRRGTASSASALHFLMPPIGLAMSAVALGEPIHPADLLGIIPIAAGIFLTTRAAAPRMAAR